MRVHFQVVEGQRRRTQVFEGIVIKRQGSGARETFTVRKQSFGVGVERTFPLHSPKIERIEVAARGDVRRAKLYYLRDRVGRASRVRERRWTGRGRASSSRRARCRRTTRRARARRSSREAAPRTAEAEAREAEERRPRRRQAEAALEARRRQAEAAEPRRPSRRADAGGRGRRRRGRAGEAPTAGDRRDEPRRASEPRAAQVARSKEKSTRGSLHRAGHDRRGRARPRARHPGLSRQAVPDPERVDGADARDRPARAGRPGELPLRRPRPRRHRRLQAAGRAPTPTPAASSTPATSPAPSRPPERSDTNFIKRVVGLPGDRLKVIDGAVYINGKRQDEPFARLDSDCGICNLPARDHDPGGPLLHDGRQPRRVRGQPRVGARCRRSGSSARPS